MRSAVVHLELHTADLSRACEFYGALLGRRPRRIRAADAIYHRLEFGGGVDGGVVECGTERALWLPYVEVASVTKTTARAIELGASVMLSPREGPAGWRSVVTTPAGGEIALWQMKR